MISRERLGPVADAVDAATADLRERNALDRLRSGDHTLWQDDPTEVADRLGWLPVVDEMQARTGDLRDFARAASADGLRHGVLLGMGGSSLFPEVLNRTFGAGPFDLRVLDTTDPAAIARVAELDLAQCLFVVASKSGSTIETRTQFDHFWEATGKQPAQFVVVTDPGSELAAIGAERGLRHVFENRPDIGGRYSALSFFGMVPGALLGVDLDGLLGRAAAADHESGLRLGAIIGAAAKAGRDKLTLVLPGEVASFGLWLEQLVAESTGKHGVGIVPVAGEELGSPEVYGDDRIFVSLGTNPALDALAAAGHPVVELVFGNLLDLGTQVLLWEIAVALSGAVLGINPFDQPDVAAAKAATAKVLEEGLPTIATVSPEQLVDQLAPGDYFVLQAFVDPGDEALLAELERVRHVVRDRRAVATTVGIGPRYLHSTGQLHKGGPPTGVFMQLVGDDPVDVPIPGRPYGFSTLKQAQAAGDLLSLRARGLRAGRVHIDELREYR
ncbi:MAG: glucose-6-phosphate isomerase [Acidimicrobiales bacterium]|nr:glucose-6-phosphate isomerase [Acidimicrobiales bacterium]